MKLSLARKQLIEMYKNALKEEQIPWRKEWISRPMCNGKSLSNYKGVNQLILSLVSYKRKYNDCRWYTYLQVQQMGYKLKNAKGQSVPVEFWSYYDKKNKKKVSYEEYDKIITSHPEEVKNFRVICRDAYVFNGDLIEGLPEMKITQKKECIHVSRYINKILRTLKVKYSEYGDRAFYSPITDQIVLPDRNKFIDKYSYYATQLHEICHSTGHKTRLNRSLEESKNKEDYAREELIAEISSSFLMQKLNIEAKAEHYDNHKAYIQSWISILENKPTELFQAIKESNKVCNYIEESVKIKNKEKER